MIFSSREKKCNEQLFLIFKKTVHESLTQNKKETNEHKKEKERKENKTSWEKKRKKKKWMKQTEKIAS